VPPERGETTTRFPEKTRLASPSLGNPPASTGLSAWSRSRAKRLFDFICVSAALPILIPALLLVALVVGLTSRGPVLFRQRRVGCGGRPFTIVKFRTLDGVPDNGPGIQRFTAIGRSLRIWKLDELPQLLNVLAGDMSLVGPRPKLREFELANPICRPGITGAATIVFAREEELLEQMEKLRSADTYRSVVMPAKQRLDSEYMARATFLSDLRLLLGTVLRRWDRNKLQTVIGAAGLHQSEPGKREQHRGIPALRGPVLPRMTCEPSAEVAQDL
jgi:lipopolysaccharide/colanic/teichoic acid biosynthesis glycosyltransferase